MIYAFGTATKFISTDKVRVRVRISTGKPGGCCERINNKKAQLSLTNPRDACEKFARFT